MENITFKLTDAEPEKEDYYNDEGILICGKCGEPKEIFFPEEYRRPGFEKHRTECQCERIARENEEYLFKEHQHRSKVKELRRECFASNNLKDASFDKCILDKQKIGLGRKYANNWDLMETENYGLLLWGNVGTGKSYFAACIANALIEKEVSVKMINLAEVMNCRYEDRQDFIKKLCRYRLLIIDDFGMERETSYGMETIYQVIDGRYQAHRPLILTTNLSWETFHNPVDLDHERIYDRVLEMCAGVRFVGNSLRTDISKQKKKQLDEILKR